MEKKVFKIEDAEVRCFVAAYNPCGPAEYIEEIKVCERVYSILTLVGPFEQDEAVCQRVYSEWKDGKHNDVFPEIR